MADTKISALTTTTSGSVGDYIPIVQGGVTKKIQLGSGGGLDAGKLQNVTISGLTSPSDIGLIGRWSGDHVPNWPDGVNVYLQGNGPSDLWTGWATMGTDTVVSVAAGNLVLTKGAAPTTFVRANLALAVSSKSVRVKWASLQADLTTVEIGTSGAGTHVTYSIAGLTSGIVDILVGANFTDIELIFNSTGNNANPVTVDFLSVYNPAVPYSTSLFDLSGNGNHGTIYGATPVAGVSGKALSFDGVNDYIKSTLPFPISSVMSLRGLFKTSLVSKGSQQTFFNYLPAIGTAGFIFVFRLDNSNTLDVQYANGAGVSTWALTNFFTGLDATMVDIHIELDWLNLSAKAYRNGVLFASTTALITPMIPAQGGYLYIGCYNDMTHFMAGSIDETRIYNRALTADEVKGLYLNPGGADCQKRAVTAVPNSLVTRTAEGLLTGGTKTPATAAAAGAVGDIAWDASYIYVCTAANTWKRAAIATW